ncbi:EF-hand domain-containing protein [Thalassoroseus pseudoceratinae]|uniref:EF-hand domain-containing protein n=1 Tax=Thalassoroseus pseudoceratinae TaxID=2713176 RepID=UPI00141F9DA0|nr:hypothetical protein [Thalassoroseus pseudoceratinae]
MRFEKLSWFAALAMVVCTAQAFAQPGGDRERRGDREGRERGERGERGEGRGFGNRGFRPPPNPIVEAIDKDKNGSLSAEEIKNAVAALKTLDKNDDGEISREEMRPEGPGRFGQGGPRPDFNPEDFAKNFVSRMLDQNDKNKDGKIAKSEVTGRFAENFDRGDTNKDGFIDKAEMEAMAKQMAERFGRGRGEGGRGRGPRGEGEGNRPPRGPRRPAVESADDL